ncbi:putative kinesin [Mytilinidion resinicola]|uniref:Kinesin n=1 Tax=Mytilinidion resinicola TaxID=574789 RepID=A0A6A6Y7S3_9PEZI|nr:putative kinesin [Mytilinidion resinicola]KAF2804598.1 putative kinesin [Mytilinidion resinicola]
MRTRASKLVSSTAPSIPISIFRQVSCGRRGASRPSLTSTLLERPETPPDPCAILPFSRDTDFVERGNILDQIHQKCAVPGSRTALVGMGGVGKSQLAIEYAYQIRERSPQTWVFWVHASSARFEQNHQDLARYLKIPGRQDPNADIFQLVHDWLRDKKRAGEWVLILDNFDDADFLFDARSIMNARELVRGADTAHNGKATGLGGGSLQPLVSYLPQCQHGSILVTTRTRDAALKLVEQRDIVTVEPMNETEAIALLQRKLPEQDDSKSVTELAEALEFMPLAIVQAAAYISRRAPRSSVWQYLETFRKSDREKMSLLDSEAGHLRRDKEAKNSIIITWHISFNHIRQIRPSAADLLALMSLFDRQGIPETLVRSQVERLSLLFHRNKDLYKGEKQDSESNEEIDGFEDDVLMLKDYSFISISEGRSKFEMHALVQLAMKTWMEANGQLERWRQHHIKILCAQFPIGEYKKWPICQELFPHVKSAAAQQPLAQESLRDWSSLLHNAAWYAWTVNNRAEAEEMAIQAMEVRKKIFGWEHKDTLDSMAMVSLAYKNKGQWGAVEKLQVQVMEITKKKRGANHLNTLAVENRKKKLRTDHPETLKSMQNLAETFSKQGRLEAAEELELQIFKIRKKKLGADHPDTLTSMNNLAFTWKDQGRDAEAISLMRQCVRL